MAFFPRRRAAQLQNAVASFVRHGGRGGDAGIFAIDILAGSGVSMRNAINPALREAG
jgi:hypothetical protein